MIELGDNMVSEDTIQRALMAHELMLGGTSFTKAALKAKTTVATLRKAFEIIGIKTRKKNNKIVLARTPKQKVPEFIQLMNQGYSATAAARETQTTIGTMKKQRVDRKKIIRKLPNGRYESRFVPLWTHSFVLYGNIMGLDDAIQGRPEGKPPAGATPAQIRQWKDYTDIRWQVDFDNFESTYPPAMVVPMYRDAIMARLRRVLESQGRSRSFLSAKFLTNAKVAAHASTNRKFDPVTGEMKLSYLEDLLERYDIHLSPKVNGGLDDSNIGSMYTTNFVDVDDIRKGVPKSDIGKFMVTFTRDTDIQEYPDPSKPITFKYDLKDEI